MSSPLLHAELKGCTPSYDSGMLRTALYVNSDSFKQQIYYYQLLPGSSQGSNFIILGYKGQLSSWNILQFFCSGIQTSLLRSLKHQPNSKDRDDRHFWGLNLAVLYKNLGFFFIFDPSRLKYS